MLRYQNTTITAPHVLKPEESEMEHMKLVPPFTRETALLKVRAAQDAWNSRDPARCSLAYTINSKWRNRDQFIQGRSQIVQFLTRKWETELDYKLRKHYFCHSDDRIAVTFQYEYRTVDGKWFRAYGNEHWTFDQDGLMKTRNASINDVEIREDERQVTEDGDFCSAGVEK
ncbi:hypothetical protein HDV01_007792 [Terramyces sp. JEL0728]|nr:hypothetical protein HDV01_007792 [Terramyces sp. JEL0728]